MWENPFYPLLDLIYPCSKLYYLDYLVIHRCYLHLYLNIYTVKHYIYNQYLILCYSILFVSFQSFHNLILAYLPKRIGYKHDAYVAREQLAYLDHNHHLGRAQLHTQDGRPVFTRKWSKRSSRWTLVSVPVPKTYSYIPGKLAIEH